MDELLQVMLDDMGAAPKVYQPTNFWSSCSPKITAEIELVGLAARKAALEAIAKKGQRRNELVRAKMIASGSLTNKARNLTRAEGGVTHYEAQRVRVVPYPVKDGKVIIRRIKWESSEKPDGGGESR